MYFALLKTKSSLGLNVFVVVVVVFSPSSTCKLTGKSLTFTVFFVGEGELGEKGKKFGSFGVVLFVFFFYSRE